MAYIHPVTDRHMQKTLNVTYRKVTGADDEFLYQVYVPTRAVELEQTDWSDEEKEVFCRMQHKAQSTHYFKHYTGARFDIILIDDEPAGRLYVDHWDKEIRIIDIALLPEFQKQGIGASILREILLQGRLKRKKVTIHVEMNNPALKLYERLGFEKIEEVNGIYFLMEWSPIASKTAVNA